MGNSNKRGGKSSSPSLAGRNLRKSKLTMKPVAVAPNFLKTGSLPPDRQSIVSPILAAAPVQQSAAPLPQPLLPLPTTHALIWTEFCAAQRLDPIRQREFQEKRIDFRDKSMRYEYMTIGPLPPTGFPLYIALHGGGGCSPNTNNSQWEHMQSYYRNSVSCGVYLAPRGISNNWCLHFEAESYPMYDRLIENMILFANVDPNRVYLTGYSAGGDGVYQIAPRMADRFAAANMSAGHRNGCSGRNLYRLPFLIQVGQYDCAYERNLDAPKAFLCLEGFRQANPDGYISECFVHSGRGHCVSDNDPQRVQQMVISNPSKWVSEGKADDLEMRNTNAIDWMAQFARNTTPSKVIWDLSTQADRTAAELWGFASHGQQCYWLDIGGHTPEQLGVNEIVVNINPVTNSIVIEGKAPNYLKLLLKESMIDFSRSVTVMVEGSAHKLKLHPSDETRRLTMRQRGDPYFIFDASIMVNRNSENPTGWAVSQEE